MYTQLITSLVGSYSHNFTLFYRNNDEDVDHFFTRSQKKIVIDGFFTWHESILEQL